MQAFREASAGDTAAEPPLHYGEFGGETYTADDLRRNASVMRQAADRCADDADEAEDLRGRAARIDADADRIDAVNARVPEARQAFRAASAAGALTEPVSDWTDDGDETADAGYRAVYEAAEHGITNGSGLHDIGRAAGAAAGASALRMEKVAEVVANAHKSEAGQELSWDDEQAVHAGVEAAMSSDSKEAGWRFAAAEEHAGKALEGDSWSQNPDDAYITAFEMIEKVSGSVMTDAEMREMADAAAAERFSSVQH